MKKPSRQAPSSDHDDDDDDADEEEDEGKESTDDNEEDEKKNGDDDDENEESEEEEKKERDEEVEDEDEVDILYTKMWYKNSNNYGIRQRQDPKQQIGSLGGKRCKLSQKSMASIADNLILRMSKGDLEEADLKGEMVTLMCTSDAD